MTKKKRKYITPMMLEYKARDDLEKERHWEAKEAFEELYHLDKEKYRTQLLLCYRSLADKLIQSGSLDKARDIVDKIKDIMGKQDGDFFDVKISMKNGNYAAAAEIYTNLLSKGSEVPALGEIPGLADALVLDFQENPSIKTYAPELYEEISAIHLALEYIAGENYEDAWEKVKGIGRNSLFSNWKLFIKGMIAFYKNEDEKAKTAFSRLSADTPLQETAKAFMALMDNTTEVNLKALSKKSLSNICFLAGYPEIAPVLTEADSLWEKGRYINSYDHIRNGLSSFPSEGTGIVGSLTRFYFNSVYYMRETEAKKFIKGFKNKHSSSSQETTESLLIKKAECLLYQYKIVSDQKFASLWEDFLNIYKEVYGDNKKLKAIVYSFLGSVFATEEIRKPSPFFLLKDDKKQCRLRNASFAEKYLNKGIALDNGDKDAYLQLLNVHEKTNKKQKLNRLLDRLIALYPDDTAILTKGGVYSVNREVYNKGIKYLEQANRLDPLDSEIKENLSSAYLKAARVCFDKGQVKNGRMIYKKAVDFGIANYHHFNRGRAYIYTRWAALEFKNRDENRGNELFQLALNNIEDPFPLIYFARLIYRCYGAPETHIQRLNTRLDNAWYNAPFPSNVVLLTDIYYYIYAIDKFKWLTDEKKKITGYALRTLKAPCSREDASRITEFALRESEFGLANKYINKMMKEDKNDALFLFYRHKLKKLSKRNPPTKKTLEELIFILNLAEKRNELELVGDLRDEINTVKEILEAEDIMKDPFKSDIFDNFDVDDSDLDFDTLKEIFEGLVPSKGNRREKKRKKK